MPVKGKITDGSDRFFVDEIRDRDVSSVPRVGTDLDRSVVKGHVGIGHAVVLVRPLGVEGQVACPLVGVPLDLLGAVNIVVPAVENAEVPVGFGKVLQGVITDKDLSGFLNFVGQIVEGDRPALFGQQSGDVERAVTVIEVLAETAEIVGRGIEEFLRLGKLDHPSVLLLEQSHRAGHDRRGERRTVHDPVSAVLFGRKGRTGSDDVDVFSVIGICSEIPTVFFQRADRDTVRIRRRVHQGGGAVVARRGDAKDIAVNRETERRGEGIVSIGSERHIYDVGTRLNRVVKTENEIR